MSEEREREREREDLDEKRKEVKTTGEEREHLFCGAALPCSRPGHVTPHPPPTTTVAVQVSQRLNKGESFSQWPGREVENTMEQM